MIRLVINGCVIPFEGCLEMIPVIGGLVFRRVPSRFDRVLN